MSFLSAHERTFLQAVAAVAYCNPFLPERIASERQALGADFVEAEALWNLRGDDPNSPQVNPLRLAAGIERLVGTLRERLVGAAAATPQELVLYEDAVLFLLLYRYADRFYDTIVRALEHRSASYGFYAAFERDWTFYFHVPGFSLPTQHEAAHLFACFFQVRRAFHHIFRYIVGGSQAAARLRAAVWQSIFTHNMRRYRRTLYNAMGDFTTLIMGPSGTGKELVARAIGLSRYMPFDPKTCTFAEDFAASFHALNLSALPSTLIESELFGHRRGAFTGATHDRRGWLELCRPLGTIFLDEIGDLDAAIQVKLLRVLQTRTFQVLGATTERHFSGKLIAATNRNLAAAIQQGQFREDLYYRLCSDLIVTPSLHEQLCESAEVLHALLLFIAQRVIGAEAEALASEVEAWIVHHLGRDYPWPGNIRELEQCVRNVLIRQEYRPPQRPAQTPHAALLQAMSSGTLTAEELLGRYCTLVFAQTGSYVETARRLRLDRRTVKSKVDPQLLEQLNT
ncbi:MAG TPA: sigma 54-interacting transcriptional regulator [Candidatus Tectomicrobia bacterium]|jgi:transcriptional regulator with AAA-type ATPase domain